MPLLVLGLLLLAVPLAYCLWDHIAKKRLQRRLQAAWGKPEALRRMDADELADAAHYCRALQAHEPPLAAVDDTTWNDLDMDSVFLSLDASASAVGSEILYAILREQGAEEHTLKTRTRLAEAFAQRQDLRLDAQTALYGIGRHAFHGAWRYLFESSFRMPPHAWAYRILAVLPMLFALLGLAHPAFLLAMAASFVLNTFVHYRSQAIWQKEAAAIRHLGAVIRSAGKLSKLRHPDYSTYSSDLLRHAAQLRALRFWLPLFGMETFGDMAVVLEYLKIFLMLDMLSLVSIVRVIKRHPQSVRALYALVGETDACLSLAQIPLRAPVLCKARFHQQAGVEAAGLTHPLIPDAVPNDLSWQQNLLISGSNASGKSTFIKAVAVNLILAQSLGLCFAQSFALRRGRVMSAMAVRDNLLAGESYFIVEIKSLKRILDAMDSGAVYCFIDEILRGTNTVERIAASSAVLESLSGRDSLCMAATHDIELTRLLADSYENHHFAETVDGSGLRFDYKIKPGPTRTRNAIHLLAQMGYPPQVIQAARRQAEAFERTGAWQ